MNEEDGASFGFCDFECCFCRGGPMRFEDGFRREGILVT